MLLKIAAGAYCRLSILHCDASTASLLDSVCCRQGKNTEMQNGIGVVMIMLGELSTAAAKLGASDGSLRSSEHNTKTAIQGVQAER